MDNEQRIAEITARCEAATPGPWETALDVGKKYYIAPPSYGIRDFCYLSGGFDREQDASFIAHSREDLPWALDIIAAQQTEIDRLTEAQRWIPVTERLPEDGNDVLVIASGKPRDNLNLDGAYEFASYLKNDGGWFFDAYPDWETPTITHWMPLPAAPEEGAGK